MKLRVKLAGFTHQIKTIAIFEEICADQQLVWLVGLIGQIVEARLLIGDRTGDEGEAPEASAQSAQQKAPFCCNSYSAWNIDRFQAFFMGPLVGSGQEWREVHA
jgi:hypothetical protein